MILVRAERPVIRTGPLCVCPPSRSCTSISNSVVTHITAYSPRQLRSFDPRSSFGRLVIPPESHLLMPTVNLHAPSFDVVRIGQHQRVSTCYGRHAFDGNSDYLPHTPHTYMALRSTCPSPLDLKAWPAGGCLSSRSKYRATGQALFSMILGYR